MNPVEILRKGAIELEPALGPEGFEFVQTGSGRGSGGDFAIGIFRRGDRKLELHFRYSLGLVAYHVGSEELGHFEFIRAVRATQVIQVSSDYPGFSSDPLDGFRHLRADIVRFGGVFTRGSSAEFAALVAWVRLNPAPRGFAALP